MSPTSYTSSDLPTSYAPPSSSQAPTEPYFSKAKKRPQRPSVSNGSSGIIPTLFSTTNAPFTPSSTGPSLSSIRSPSPHYHRPITTHPYSPTTSLFERVTAFLSPSSSSTTPLTRSRTLSAPLRSESPDSPEYRSSRPRKRRKRDRWIHTLVQGWGFNKRSAWRSFFVFLVVLFLLWRWVWEVQFEFSVFRKQWIRKEVLDLSHPQIDLAATCFAPSSLAASSTPSKWNTSLSTHTPSHISLSSTISLTHQHDCFAYSSTLQPSPLVPLVKTYYHTYWRADLLPFQERQAWTVKSFLATQSKDHSVLIIWSNGDLEALSPIVRDLLLTYPGRFEVRRVNVGELARGTALEGRWELLLGPGGLPGGVGRTDKRAWIDGDLVRLLVLWNFGGIWTDMDIIFVRDLHVLMEDEWVTQWDCYDKPYQSLNGALLHFHSHSPYLCTFLTLISLSPPPKPASTTWGSRLYLKAFRRLIDQEIVPFQVLPWCFADPRNCRTDKRVPDPFLVNPGWWGGRRWKEGGEEELRRTLNWREDRGVFTLHLHNQWAKDFPVGGWVRKLLLEPMDEYLDGLALKEREGEGLVLRFKEEEGEDEEALVEARG
ncbi:hypothetical protein BDY24DRAFT_398505 [Mrakia frigida]|uniref:uncharacterized protein n=1 Tax=Mrakia frigida TaxID=29902 RepID=UPI003FCC2225